MPDGSFSPEVGLGLSVHSGPPPQRHDGWFRQTQSFKLVFPSPRMTRREADIHSGLRRAQDQNRMGYEKVDKSWLR